MHVVEDIAKGETKEVHAAARMRAYADSSLVVGAQRLGRFFLK